MRIQQFIIDNFISSFYATPTKLEICVTNYCFIMNILQKFDVLKAIGLTKTEADLYFANAKLIPMLYPIVYRNTKKGERFWQKDLEILPYLDTSRVQQVWGIDFGGVLIYKTDSLDDSILEESYGRLPDLQTLTQIFQAETKINLCLHHLCIYGVENVDFIDSSYAYKTEESNNQSLSVCLIRINHIQTWLCKRAYIRPVL